MKKKMDIVMWDLDGTLLDTKPGIINAIKDSLNICGYSMLTEEELETFIGPPFTKIFPQYFHTNEQETKEFIDTFRDIYWNKELFNATPFDGILEVVKKIKQKGLKQALCTYKAKEFAEKLLKKFDFYDYFDYIYGSSTKYDLPKSEMIVHCLTMCGIIDRKKSVLIGDTRYDFAASIQAECHFIAANYGYGEILFKQADLTNTLIGHIDYPNEIFEYIE